MFEIFRNKLSERLSNIFRTDHTIFKKIFLIFVTKGECVTSTKKSRRPLIAEDTFIIDINISV